MLEVCHACNKRILLVEYSVTLEEPEDLYREKEKTLYRML